MNTMIKKFVDQEFMTEEQGKYIEDAIMRKESIVLSGHRSSGTRNLLAALMAVAKKNFPSVQVRKAENLEKEAEFYLMAGMEGLEEIISDIIAKDSSSFVTIKEPEHPVSLMKILKKNFKNGKGIGIKVQTLECVKVDDVPKLDKIIEFHLTEEGKVKKTTF